MSLSDNHLQAIKDSVKTEVLKIGDVEYTTRPAHDVRTEDPVPKTLLIHTLTGLVDYMNLNVDGLAFARGEQKMAFIRVDSHAQVDVISDIFGRFQQRMSYVVARFEELFGKSFQFGQAYDLESFNVSLQSLFLQTRARDGLLALVGNIKEEAVQNYADDGVTQTVIARTGAALVKNVDAPNPVVLQPFRTFREIEQPQSKFVFRLCSGKNGEKPKCALFESDGGAWKLTAIEAIKKYIAEKVPGVAIIG